MRDAKFACWSRQLHRITAQFERDPARFLFGDRQKRVRDAVTMIPTFDVATRG